MPIQPAHRDSSDGFGALQNHLLVVLCVTSSHRLLGGCETVSHLNHKYHGLNNLCDHASTSVFKYIPTITDLEIKSDLQL
jgi:hypothetical protein